MRSQRACWIILGLSILGYLAGCEEPGQISPITPPGVTVPHQPLPGDEAQAQGEMPTPLEPIKEEPQVAVPTAKGETKSTAGGVKYETLKEGTGRVLQKGQLARLHYKGRLENGYVFADSRKDGKPIESQIITNKVITGWVEGLVGMKVGELRKLTIPPALAYRDTGFPKAKIPPNATLIFEVELLDILSD